MSSWTIDKQFSFCYGHRVWSQELISDYCESGDASCKCRHLHGHEGLVHIFLEGDELTRGMVTDFKHLGWLKNFLDANLDHKFIIDKNDPLFAKIINGIPMTVSVTGDENKVFEEEVLEVSIGNSDVDLAFVPSYIPGTDEIIGYYLDVRELTGAQREFYEGFFIVDYVPTSENLAKWLYDVVNFKMALIDVSVSHVSWNETPKSRAVYSGE